MTGFVQRQLQVFIQWTTNTTKSQSALSRTWQSKANDKRSDMLTVSTVITKLFVVNGLSNERIVKNLNGFNRLQLVYAQSVKLIDFGSYNLMKVMTINYGIWLCSIWYARYSRENYWWAQITTSLDAKWITTNIGIDLPYNKKKLW